MSIEIDLMKYLYAYTKRFEFIFIFIGWTSNMEEKTGVVSPNAQINFHCINWTDF